MWSPIRTRPRRKYFSPPQPQAAKRLAVQSGVWYTDVPTRKLVEVLTRCNCPLLTTTAMSTPEPHDTPPNGQLLIYQDGATRLQVRMDGLTVWLSQRLLAELYQVSIPTVNEHLANIYGEGELDAETTIRNFRIVQREGKRDVARSVEHYNLDAILAVGYRVRSPRGTAFRQWATARLSELLVKGFTLDDERIKAGRPLGADYFDELLARIRDIRSSERLFYQKITDIYATSIDYDANVELTQLFFQTVQNKMHWAAHGHTAAEIVRQRADASKSNMGLATWKNAPTGPVRKQDVMIAKNYLASEEIEALDLIVSAYLDFAELQARSHRPMHMADWVAKLDDFIRLTSRDVLTHAGRVTHEQAQQHAVTQYEQYDQHRRQIAASADSDFDAAVKRITKEPSPAEPKRRKKKSDSSQDEST